MTFRLRMLPSAAFEAETAEGWYEQQRSGLGALFLAELVSVLDKIVAGRAAEAISVLAIFLTARRTVVVVAVAHRRRLPEYWRRQALRRSTRR